MKWLVPILTALIQALLPWAVKQKRPVAGDASGDRRIAARLRNRVLRHWGRA